MTGTPSQIEWAEQIRPRVQAEFRRVADAFSAVAARQPEPARSQTQFILAILAEKQNEALAHTAAGYYIRHWQELGPQVRQLLHQDPRVQALRAQRLSPSPTQETP